jgi:hypothetical protein
LNYHHWPIILEKPQKSALAKHSIWLKLCIQLNNTNIVSAQVYVPYHHGGDPE